MNTVDEVIDLKFKFRVSYVKNQRFSASKLCDIRKNIKGLLKKRK